MYQPTYQMIKKNNKKIHTTHTFIASFSANLPNRKCFFPYISLTSNSFFYPKSLCFQNTKCQSAIFEMQREKKSIKNRDATAKENEKWKREKDTTIRISCNGIPFAPLTKRVSVVFMLQVYLWFFVFHFSRFGFVLIFLLCSDLHLHFSFFRSFFLFSSHLYVLQQIYISNTFD